MIDTIEKTIYSLEYLPERGALRRVGVYATGEYRQLIVKNFIVVYRVVKEQREVYIVTVRYAQGEF